MVKPYHTVQRHIRISSNPKDYDIDNLTEQLMRQRTWHRDFNSEMGHEANRISIKDFVFQDTVLQSYKMFVDKKKRRIDEAEYRELLLEKYKEGKLPKEFVEKQCPERELKEVESKSQGKWQGKQPLLSEGPNLKDMQRAFWLNNELKTKPYYGFD